MIDRINTVSFTKPSRVKGTSGKRINSELSDQSSSIIAKLEDAAHQFGIMHYPADAVWDDQLAEKLLPTDIVSYSVDRLDQAPAPEISQILMKKRASYILVVSLQETPDEEKMKFYEPLRGEWNGKLFIPVMADKFRTKKILHIQTLQELTKDELLTFVADVILHKQSVESLN